MTRRSFAAALLSASLTPKRSILVHEHVLVDFIGADKIGPGRYDPAEVFKIALPKLQEIRALGCRRLQECTPNFLGRDPCLLRRLSKASGIDIWTNTGLYAAAEYKGLPAFARTESADQLAQRWIAEARNGVDGERIRFIKLGVNKGPLPELDRKIVEAGILTSKATGFTMAVHTGDGRAALDQLSMVQASGLPTSKWVWVHAQNEVDLEVHEKVARAGGWVELDGINQRSARWHLTALQHLTKKGLLHRVLISQDSGWYRVGEPGGGQYNGYRFIYDEFLPSLQDPKWAEQLLWTNPRAAFGS